MTTGRSRRSSSQLKKKRQGRVASQKLGRGRTLRLEGLEDRRLLAIGPQLIGVQPNRGDLLTDGTIRNVAPEELTFRFNEGQVIDDATLGSILVTRAGGDGQFTAATARTDFNTGGQVVMQFQAVTPGPLGNEISLVFSKSDPGAARLPRVQVEGREIYIELNANPLHRSTAADLIAAINNNPAASGLVRPVVVFGPTNTPISAPAITYTPVRLTGANVAQASTNFSTGGNLDVTFTAVQTGPAANGISIEFTKVDRGGAASPRITVVDSRRIRIELNSNAGNQTTAGQLVSVFNATPAARAIAVATLRVGSATTNVATPAINYSPLVLSGASDVAVTPGYVGLGSSPREVIFRFAERLPDDLYRIDIAGTGSNPLRNTAGFSLGDATDNGIDDGADFSLRFELDLGAQILGVVPQPIFRTASGALSQSTSQIEIYFNDDDLDPITATNPNYYKLIYTADTATNADDIVYKPTAVQYFPESDRVTLTFAQPLHQLVPAGGTGSFRLRIGTNEEVASQANPQPPQQVDLSGVDVGSTVATAHDIMAANPGTLTGSFIFSSAIQPQIDPIPMPGSNDEPGHRNLPQRSTDTFALVSHLVSVGDSSNGITTLYYNFRPDYGTDPEGNPLTNLITNEQKQRAREAFEIWGRSLGVQFVETATQGFTIATGDLRAISPTYASVRGDGVAIAFDVQPLMNDLRLVLDASENWYSGFGPTDSLARLSWFESAMQGIGSLLGLGDTSDLPPGTWAGSDAALGFGQTPEPIYPGDHDIVHGQYLYRPEGQDVDLYRFEITQTGVFSAETNAQRRAEASLLDTYLKLYRSVGGSLELLAANDDYYGNDSYLEQPLEPGVYYIGVSSKGNEQYRPDVANSGYGGVSEGAYDLRLNFRPNAFSSIQDIDNSLNVLAGQLSQQTPLDGNGDGVPGGVFNFWFRVDSRTIFVDKSAPAGGSGTLLAPFNNLTAALTLAGNTASNASPRVVRVVGNGGTDGQLATPEDARPYEIGFNLQGQPLADGSQLEVPQGVTLMIDRGAVFKLRRGYIDVGSSSPTIDRSGGALQILGTPRLIDVGGNVVRDAQGRPVPGSVFFTSYNDERLGGDSNPAVAQTPAPGDWGGLIFRNDLDRNQPGRKDFEAGGSFVNYVNQADIRYGGGELLINGLPRVIAPIHAVTSRPTVTNNTITFSADAAMSMNPDSFEETNFHAARFQTVPFTSDYTRIGPDVHGNRLANNSINGLFVRMETAPGSALERMTVPGRWNDTDIVHVVAEPLRIQGSPGGPIQRLAAPDAALVRLQTQAGGAIPAGTIDYRLTFVDAAGNETPASNPTVSALIGQTNATTGATQSVLLTNLPAVPAGFAGLRVYRSIKLDYELVAQLNPGTASYLDNGSTLGRLLLGSDLHLESRLAGRLMIDPGAVVKLNGATIETAFGSQLIAEGVQGREVVFTSLLDPRYGAGGTFQTSAEIEDLEPGGWAGLYAGPMSQISLDHAVVAYGGGIAEIPGAFAGFNALEIQQAKARVTNSLFEFNDNGSSGLATTNRAGRGSNGEAVIFVRGAQPILVNNVLRDNSGPAISINVNALNSLPVTDFGRSTGLIDLRSDLVDNQGPLIRENRLGNNDINGMRVRGGTLTTQSVWDDTDIVHVVLDDAINVPDFHTYGGLRLQSSPRESLVVKLLGDSAGIVATGRPLDITDRIGGMLHILGQPGFPVILTSLRDDTAAAGFQPDGTPQGDTNNDGDAPGLGGTRPQLPTLPDVPDPDDPLRIDNNVPVTIPGYFSLLPDANGSLRGGDGVTAQGLTQYFENVSFIYDFLNYLDVGMNGQAIDLASTIVGGPLLFGPDQLVTTGIVPGVNGPINWQVRTYFLNGYATLYNEVALFTTGGFGDVRFINYLDEDVLGVNDDLLYVSAAPGTPNFEVYTLDNAERIGFSQGGVYTPGAGLINATWDGWAADKFPLLKNTITQSGTTFSPSGTINTDALTPFNDPALGLVHGLADVTTAFAWTLDPTADLAVITTHLNLIRQDPATDEAKQNFAGDWQSVRLEQFSHDRNVEVIVELESAQGTQPGSNEAPATAQHLGSLAPHEKAGDENRRLGFEVHGSLNRAGDVDVYSFDADAGTEVWLDIDRTARSLDTVLELVDANGLLLARSDNSFAEAANPGLLHVRTLPGGTPAVQVNPLSKSPFNSQDLWSTNPGDAGMRVVLPGTANSTNTYHVRVRSASSNLNSLTAGTTTGIYQLQVRLRELDELPGSTVRMADIRYATNGIELIGQPYHSPLTGEAAEIEVGGQPTNDNNNNQGTAQDLGNLLGSERGTLSVAGELFTSDDVDWYQFEVAYGPPPPAPSFVDLTRGTWDFAGTLAGTNWAGSTLVFQTQTASGADFAVTGYIDWVSGGTARGRELFNGTLFADNTIRLTGTQLQQPQNLTLGVYTATVSGDGRTITNGTRGPAPTGLPVGAGTWGATLVAQPSATDAIPRHAAVVFDIDYADGLSRANTNLWVFDDQARLVLIGRDSNTPDDRPVGGNTGTEDLSRGSLGALDPYIGSVQLPAAGFAPGIYYVAVSSNAVLPPELAQFLDPAPANPLVRLEPINSVNRIAEDRIAADGVYTTGNAPQIPVLFGVSNLITLFPPDGSRLRDGETFTVVNANGNFVTYEFDFDGAVRGSNVPVSFRNNSTPLEIGESIAAAVTDNPPLTLSVDDLPDLTPTSTSPLVASELTAEIDALTGAVRLNERVTRVVLLNEVTTTDPLTNQLQVNQLTRTTTRLQEPTVRQQPAPGRTDTGLYVSRPAAQPFRLGDVTLFVSQPAYVVAPAPTQLLNRTHLLSVDPFTGQVESNIGVVNAPLGDIAMHPQGLANVGGATNNGGGLFGYSTPYIFDPVDDSLSNFVSVSPTNRAGLFNPTDGNVGNYIQVNPGANPANLGNNVGNSGIETYEADPANLAQETDSNVGVFFHALTFNNQETHTNVRGFAIGTRGDTYIDPVTGDVTSTALNIPNPANVIFEFQPNSGVAVSQPAGGNRTGGGILTAGGTQIRDRGVIDTRIDARPSGGTNTTISGVTATNVDTTVVPPLTTFTIADGDFFQIDRNGDSIPDVTFEFDTGPEFYFNVDPTGATGQFLFDGDAFDVDGVRFEFDTGTVLVVNANAATDLLDGSTIQIWDNAPNPTTHIFEFDNDGNFGSNLPITFTAFETRQSIITRIVSAINSAPNFRVQAVQQGASNIITLLNESPTSGAIVNAAGVQGIGQPGVTGGAVAIPVEATMTVDEVAWAIRTVIDGTQAGGVQAGAVGNRLNFLGAQTATFVGQGTPVVFSTINPTTTPPSPTGQAGAINPFSFPVPFLISDNAAEIATRVLAAVTTAGFSATQVGSTVLLESAVPPNAQSTFVCSALNCPLRSGGVAPGGLITGMAFVGEQLYAVTGAGALFRIADSEGGAFDQDSENNEGDYIDGSLERLRLANPVEREVTDPATGQVTIQTFYEPIQFAGLVAGPQNAEGGLYENLLFGIDVNGRLFAFDTWGRPQPVFANGAVFTETNIASPNGLAFSNLDDNLWHVNTVPQDPANPQLAGRGIDTAFDGSRIADTATTNPSLYFGYESDVVQSQFGIGNFAPATTPYTYDFPGGAQGSLISNPFSLAGYASADRPTLYFNYFLETEGAANPANTDTSLADPFNPMRDSFRVYIAGDDGRWQLLTTNNTDRDTLNLDGLDEFDPFTVVDPVTGQRVPEQLFRRGATFDGSATWRQARVDLAPYAGQANLRLRFEFSTAGGLSTGGRIFNVGDVGESTVDLNTAGNELRALAGGQLRDGQQFTLTDLVEDPVTGEVRRDVVAVFEFDMGPTIVAPTGAVIDDGDTFTVDGRIYEFDLNGATGVTNNVPHTPVPFTGNETAADLAAIIQQVLTANPPPAEDLIQDLVSLEPNDTLGTAFRSPLDGGTANLRGVATIGDNFDLTDPTLDVDMISFRLDAGDTVLIETDTTRLQTTLNTYLRLFDASGNELAANDNKDPTNAFSRDSRIQFTASQRGTYYVGVSANHNRDYLPTAANSGTPDGTPTEGFYEYVISVVDPAGPQRVGNRLNLPNANTVTVSGLPASFVEGAGGVAPFALDSTGLTVPVASVAIHAGMTSLHVADAIQLALADQLAGSRERAFKTRDDIVQIVKYGIGDPGPLGLSGPSDPKTLIPHSGLFGDQFGSFGWSAGPNGQITPATPGAPGMRDNAHPGVFIDDIIIGFAGRGEMVTGANAATTPVAFVPNTTQPANETNTGAYQLEIRQATPYALTDATPEPTLVLDTGFDINDRLAEGVSITINDGSVFADGQTFTIRGGLETVVFEFDDLTAANGVAAGHVAIPFLPSDSAVVMARRIRDLLNQPAMQQRLQLRVTTSDGVISGTASTSNRLHLTGEVSVIAGLIGDGPTGNVPVLESNDTLADAVETGILGGGRVNFFATGFIGDNPALSRLGADVDLFKVELNAGEVIAIDIDASEINSPLDSLLRVFDETGAPVLLADEFGVLQPLESDDDLAPGERALLNNDLLYNFDSYLNFVAPAAGTYYIGVSAFGNGVYDPRVAGSGREGRTTGQYQIRIERPLMTPGLEVETYQRQGDKNLFRDQGQISIHSNRISNALEYGILIDAGIRSSDGMPTPGPVRNLAIINTWNLAPGATVSNNIIAASGTAGIRYTGHPAAATPTTAQATGVIPFGRIVNNTIVGTIESTETPIDVALKPLPGLLGGFTPATRVYYADLSSLTTAPISSLTITDNSVGLVDDLGLPASGIGRLTGFDLDAIKFSTSLATNSSQVPGLPALNVLDFSPAGTILNSGTQLDPVATDLFGTVGGFVDNSVATLGAFDADAAPGTTSAGFVSLGENGTITFRFNPPLVVTSPLYVYLGEANDVGEMNLASISVTSVEVPRGRGIVVENNVSPTLLNNVLSTLEVGIEVGAGSTSTVIGGTLYHGNTTNVIGAGLGTQPIVVDPNTSLFVDPGRGNYYPAPGSPLIDSSIDSLEDRSEMRQLRTPLGISESPILAPAYDVSGQLRIDDPNTAPPPGLGQNVFKDRGAQDRADFAGPRSILSSPQDNGPSDLDQSATRVNLLRASLDHFAIQLSDREGSLIGIGIDDASVTKSTVRVFQDGRLLDESRDYLFSYNATSNTIRLTPLAGVWQQESNYVIEVVGSSNHVVFARSGDKLVDGDQFQLVDNFGGTTTFEYDSGYVMQIPRTLALQVPSAGGAAGGVADGDTITIATPTRTVTLELDNNGAVTPGNQAVLFTAFSTRGEVADAIVAGLKAANVQLSPINAGNGLVHLGANGTQTMSVVSATIGSLGVENGVLDGQVFSIDDGSKVVTFEFNSAGGVGPNRVPIQFSMTQTHEQIAQAVATTINSQNLGLNTAHVGNGTVQIGGGLNHVVRIVNANVELTGQPGAQLAFGLRLPTIGGSVANQIVDGETFTISNGINRTVTFEFDRNSNWTAGNTPIPYTNTTTAWQLANTLVNRITNANLGLFPFNAGNGIVVLGGDSLFSLDVTNTSATQVGLPGESAAVAIPFTPTEAFTAVMSAANTAQVINAQGIAGLSAVADQDRVRVTGAQSGSGSFVGFVEGIRDLAGNSMVGNQADGTTSFTVFIGIGMDYGDAPAPYPTLRADNGARHVIVEGFSLGNLITLDADGQPSAGADADQGDDGVFFDASTPLIPNRNYNITVATSGIGTVVPFGVLDAWIDWNRDGDWNDSGERIISGFQLTPSIVTNGRFTFRTIDGTLGSVPPGAVAGDTYARFRLSTTGSSSPMGEVSDGEVEDYRVTIVSNPWQNPVNRFDVDNSGAASPVDVLLVINYLNGPNPTNPLPIPRPADRPFLDVNGDGAATASDVLQVINHLNQLNNQLSAEGEASPRGNHLDDVLAGDEGWMDMLSDVDRALQAADARDSIFASL
ncbi:MAG: pre-peptidase C-terminal domain-containing protein [Pirellulaceae bacterium]|nr:pre-peptidase C-terminal domain-containing protein [Pirellulaceae bacterium]